MGDFATKTGESRKIDRINTGECRFPRRLHQRQNPVLDALVIALGQEWHDWVGENDMILDIFEIFFKKLEFSYYIKM